MGERQVITLWPDGAPDPIPGVGPEAWFRMPSGPGAEVDWVRNVSQPTLTVIPADPAKANGTGVLNAPDNRAALDKMKGEWRHRSFCRRGDHRDGPSWTPQVRLDFRNRCIAAINQEGGAHAVHLLHHSDQIAGGLPEFRAT